MPTGKSGWMFTKDAMIFLRNGRVIIKIPLTELGTLMRMWRNLAKGKHVFNLESFLNLFLQSTGFDPVEVEEATKLQYSLLPTEIPRIEGYSIGVLYRSKGIVSGDYYDFIPFPKGRWGICVGDAKGHGIAAGLMMSAAKSLVQAYSSHIDDPSYILAEISKIFAKTFGQGNFMTMIYCLLDPNKHTLKIASAGHPPALLKTQGEEIKIKRIPKKGFPALGFPLIQTSSSGNIMPEVNLEIGNILLMYTDGILEAESKVKIKSKRTEKRMMGIGGLEYLIKNAFDYGTASFQASNVISYLQYVLDHYYDVTDDITAIAILRMK